MGGDGSASDLLRSKYMFLVKLTASALHFPPASHIVYPHITNVRCVYLTLPVVTFENAPLGSSEVGDS